MSVRTRYDPDTGIIFFEISGTMDPDAVLIRFHEIFENPEIPNNADAIWDLRQMDLSAASPEIMRTVISNREKLAEQRKGSKYAFVVANKDGEMMVKLYWALSEHLNQERNIFWSREEAVTWLQESRGTSALD